MNSEFNAVSAIRSEAGKIAKRWAIEAIYEAMSGDATFSPTIFIARKVEDLVSQGKSCIGVGQRYWIYLGLLAVGLDDEFYKTLQAELIAAYEVHCSEMQPELEDGFVFQNRFYPIQTNGSLQEFYFQLGCGSQFLDSLHDYLDSVRGGGMYSIKVLEMLSTSVTVRIAVKPRESNTAPKHSYVAFLRNDMNSEYNPE